LRPVQANSLDEAVEMVLSDFERASRGELGRQERRAGPTEPVAAPDAPDVHRVNSSTDGRGAGGPAAESER
jgi:hypothetical protein